MSTVGHPTQSAQQRIDDEIRFYFEHGIGEMECVNRTKHSWRTVHARYDKYFKLLIHHKDQKFLVEQEKAKAQALVALDNQLAELLSIQGQINQSTILAQEDAKNNKRVMTHDEIQPALRSKLAWLIADITDKKSGLAMTPATAEHVRTEVREYIDAIQSQDYTKELKQLGK